MLPQISRIILPLLLAILLHGAFAASPARADQAEPRTATSLTVGTSSAPPFAIRGDDGQWSGLAIELMEEIGLKLGLTISWTPVDSTNAIIEAVAAGRADAGIAAVTITAEREKIVDFSHPYYVAGLAIAVDVDQTHGVRDVFYALSSPEFLLTVATLALLLAVMGALIWVAEHRRNSDQFHKEAIKGIGSGFWWAAVTMATVGYGDKTPITPVGRTLAVVWMFAALILTAVFTAHLTSALTLRGISGAVTSVRDLPRARVGIVEHSASSVFFEERFIPTQSFPDVGAGLAALRQNKIDAFVHDESILKFFIARDYQGVAQLLPEVFEQEDYGIVLPSGSPLREPINQAILNLLDLPQWSTIRQRYLGPEQ